MKLFSIVIMRGSIEKHLVFNYARVIGYPQEK